jgi:hypothetical protein
MSKRQNLDGAGEQGSAKAYDEAIAAVGERIKAGTVGPDAERIIALWAAAPDLLEAARVALEHIEEWIERPEREDADGMYVPLGGERAVMELLGDAIEKAEGV